MDRRCAAGALLALAACIAYAAAAPSYHTALDLYENAPEGCYYNFQHYGEGDRIMTNEPCLNCTCHNRMLMCYLRVCPFTKPIGQDCTVEKRADQCCPIVTCPDVPVDLLTSTSTSSPAEYGATGLGKLDKYGCSINGKYFPEGSKVPPTPNKPCEHCYCIRNMTTCVMQECTLHVDGCTPIYHKDVCCPVRYSCDHPEDEIPLLDDMTTTVRPTPGYLLTTTTLSPVTLVTQDCVHDEQIIPDGALLKTEKACEHCYCMKGDIVCVVQECGTPMENEGKNCTSLPPREGQCCPDTYICEGDELTTETTAEHLTEVTAESNYEDITTLTPPRRTGSEGSGYRHEPEFEGSGEEHATVNTIDSSEVTPEKQTPQIIDETFATTEEVPLYTTQSLEIKSEKASSEPNKEQNTVPSGLSEDETSKPSLLESTTSSEEKTKESTGSTDETSHTTGSPHYHSSSMSDSSISREDDYFITTEPTFRKEDEGTASLETSTRKEITELTTLSPDLIEGTGVTSHIELSSTESTPSEGKVPSMETEIDMQTVSPSIEQRPDLEATAPSVDQESEMQKITPTEQGQQEQGVAITIPALQKEPGTETIIPSSEKESNVETTTLSLEQKHSIETTVTSVEYEPSSEISAPSRVPKPGLQSSTVFTEQEPDLQTTTPFIEELSRETTVSSLEQETIKEVVTPSTESESDMQTIAPTTDRKQDAETHTPSEESFLLSTTPSIEKELGTETSAPSIEQEPGVEKEPSEEAHTATVEQKPDLQTNTPSVDESDTETTIFAEKETSMHTTVPSTEKDRSTESSGTSTKAPVTSLETLVTAPEQVPSSQTISTSTVKELDIETPTPPVEEEPGMHTTTLFIEKEKSTETSIPYTEAPITPIEQKPTMQTISSSIEKETTTEIPIQSVKEESSTHITAQFDSKKEQSTEHLVTSTEVPLISAEQEPDAQTTSPSVEKELDKGTTIPSVEMESDVQTIAPFEKEPEMETSVPATETSVKKESDVQTIAPFEKEPEMETSAPATETSVKKESDMQTIAPFEKESEMETSAPATETSVKKESDVLTIAPFEKEPEMETSALATEKGSGTEVTTSSSVQEPGMQTIAPSVEREGVTEVTDLGTEISLSSKEPSTEITIPAIEQEPSIETIIPSVEQEPKSTTAQLPDYTREVEETVQSKEPTTETVLEISTSDITKPKKEPSFSTPEIETGSELETTTINIFENEIEISPGRIPGEGDCLLNGITYKNESVVPNTNKCHTGCKCVSSIVKCDPIICSPPPEYMDNCQSVYDTPESCCPTYICDHTPETIPPQSHSQMSGTESPTSMPTIECNGDQCQVKEEKVSPNVSSDICTSGDCLEGSSRIPETSECGSEGCSEHIQIPTHAPPDSMHPSECIGSECPSESELPPSKSCEGEKCSKESETVPPKNEPQFCTDEEDCKQTNIPEINISGCEGESCKDSNGDCGVGECDPHVVSPPQTDEKTGECNEENGCKKPIHEECNDDECKKKQASELGGKIPSECTDSDCIQQVPVSTTQVSQDTETLSTESAILRETSQESITDKPDETVTNKLSESSITMKEQEQDSRTELPSTTASIYIEKESEGTPAEITETSSVNVHEESTKTPILHITESEEIETKTSEQPEVSQTSDLEKKKTPEPLVTEKSEVSTELPEAYITEKKSQEESTISSASSEEVTESLGSYVTKTPPTPIVSEEKTVTQTSEEPTIESHTFVTEFSDIHTTQPQDVDSKKPEISVTEESYVTHPEYHITQPQETSKTVEDHEAHTSVVPMTQEQRTEIPLVTESQEIPTAVPEETSTKLQETDTEKDIMSTETPESYVTKQQQREKTTEAPELYSTKSEEETKTPEKLDSEKEFTTETFVSEKTTTSAQKQEAPATELPESSLVTSYEIDTKSTEPSATEIYDSSTKMSERETMIPEMITEIKDATTKSPLEYELSTKITESAVTVTEKKGIELPEKSIIEEGETPTPSHTTESEKPFTNAPDITIIEQETTVSLFDDKHETEVGVSVPVTSEIYETEPQETSRPELHASTSEFSTKTTESILVEQTEEIHKELPELDISKPQTTISELPEEESKEPEEKTQTELPVSPVTSEEEIVTNISSTQQEEIQTETPMSLVTKPHDSTVLHTRVPDHDEKQTEISQFPTTELYEITTKLPKPSLSGEEHVQTEVPKVATEIPELHITEQVFVTKTSERTASEKDREEFLTSTVTESEKLTTVDTDYSVTKQLEEGVKTIAPTVSEEEIKTELPEKVSNKTESPVTAVPEITQEPLITIEEPSVTELQEGSTEGVFTTKQPSVSQQEEEATEESFSTRVEEPSIIEQQVSSTNVPLPSEIVPQQHETVTETLGLSITEEEKTTTELSAEKVTELLEPSIIKIPEQSKLEEGIQTEIPVYITTESQEEGTKAPGLTEEIRTGVPEIVTEHPKKVTEEPTVTKQQEAEQTKAPVTGLESHPESPASLVTGSYEISTKASEYDIEKEKTTDSSETYVTKEEVETKTPEVLVSETSTLSHITEQEQTTKVSEAPMTEQEEIHTELSVSPVSEILKEGTTAEMHITEPHKFAPEVTEPSLTTVTTEVESETQTPEVMHTESHILGTKAEELEEPVKAIPGVQTTEQNGSESPEGQETSTELKPFVTIQQEVATESSVPKVTITQTPVINVQEEVTESVTTIEQHEISTKVPEIHITEREEIYTKLPPISLVTEKEEESTKLPQEPVTEPQQDVVSKVSEIIDTEKQKTVTESVGGHTKPQEIVTEHSSIFEEEQEVTTKASEKSTYVPQEEITKPSIEVEHSSEPKYEYPETTPYIVELEEHTQIAEEISTVVPSEEKLATVSSETDEPEQYVQHDVSTEKSMDEITQTVAPTKEPSDEKEEKPLSTKEPSDEETNQTTLSTVKEVPKKSTKPSVSEEVTFASPESQGGFKYSTELPKEAQDKESSTFVPSQEEKEDLTTPFISSETEKPTPDLGIKSESEKQATSSTEKPVGFGISHDTTPEEEEFILATTKITTAKIEEEASTKSPTYHDKFTKPATIPSETPLEELPKPGLNELHPTEEVPPPEDEGHFPPIGSGGYGSEPDYGEEEQAFGPGTCRYGGKVYVSAQQIPRDDPCDFCFCFRSDIICLQQSCPPPIHGCHEEPIQGFCCPRYECPVSMATTLNVTTTTTTTTTTLPPHFLPHAYKGAAQRRGCHIKGHTYKVGEVVRASSGPCLHCTCGGDGQMKCDPKACTPEPMLRQMIAAAVSAKRRR